MRLRRITRRAATIAGAMVVAVVVVTPGAASAHAKLMSTSPGEGSRVAAGRLHAVVLHFDDVVKLVPGALQVRTASGRTVATGSPQVTGTGRTLRAALPRRLAAGGYRVEWRILADDGHIESGQFGFTLTPGAPGLAPVGRSSAGQSALPADQGQPTWPVVAAVLLALGAGLGAALVVRRYVGLVRAAEAQAQSPAALYREKYGDLMIYPDTPLAPADADDAMTSRRR